MLDSWVLAPHGQFKSRPAGSDLIIRDTYDNDCGFLLQYSSGGAFLAMTLDPDYHTYQGSDCAHCFLNNIVAWAKERAYESMSIRARTATTALSFGRALSQAWYERRKGLILAVFVGVTTGVFCQFLVSRLI
jgi:hypothetical protein